MKSYEQQCAERLEEIAKQVKAMNKPILDISLWAKVAKENLEQMNKTLREAKESDPENFINDYISKED
ncbi:hypothetical protein [Bacteroides clarus]|uniref:hypothetical protein n=1 Tax=Bacteroides clarus TaxID=626929 RepID=UPI00248DFC84|nr:hypothetical protein [Bacteroides clarus]